MSNELYLDQVKVVLTNADERERNDVSSITALQIARYARRKPSDPSNFAVEKALRQNSNIRNLYFDLLSSRSQAASHFAAAAASEDYPKRVIGHFDLNVTEDTDGSFIVIEANSAEGRKLEAPRQIEFRTPDGAGWLRQLPSPIKGQQIIILNGDDEEDIGLAEALKMPDLKLFLR